jgi:putative RecB family exonuclease
MMLERADGEVTPQLPTDVPEHAPGGVEGVRLTTATSLSPSRASDFMSCPLLYRFRVIDRLPERPSLAAVRGSVVHKVLEELFDLPAGQRTHDRASLMLGPVWETLLAEEPELAEMWSGGAGSVPPDTRPSSSAPPAPPPASLASWLEECRDLLGRYFELEDPQRLEPAEREVHVVTTLASGLTIHGYIDRVDVAPTGELRIVDYKTGASPSEWFEAKALFQMKFYALVLWRTRGVVPAQLKLIYLADVDTLTYTPSEPELVRFEGTLKAIWAAIARAAMTGDFRPSPSKLCNWCDHKALCPSFGGTPPPYPSGAVDVVTREPSVAEIVKAGSD